MSQRGVKACLRGRRISSICPVHGPKSIGRRYASNVLTPIPALNAETAKALIPTMEDLVLWRWDHVTVAMSGGVDSAVTLRMLAEYPLQLNVIFMRNWDPLLSEENDHDQGETSYSYSNNQASSSKSPCGWQKDWETVQKVCAHVGIPESRVQLVDLSKDYWTKVFEPSLSIWEHGGTPNPDVACNREIKFGSLLRYIPKKARSFLATGHYARIKRVPHATRLIRANDTNKDQSYYLSSLTDLQLRRAITPLASIEKSDVRRLAKFYGLPNANKEESMGLCFVGERAKFSNFISQYLPKPPEQGYIVDSEGKRLAPHNGLWTYTIGQRASVAGRSEKLYVAKKGIGESGQDILAVPGGNNPALLCTELLTHDFHWIAGKTPKGFVPGGHKRVRVQLRHRMEPISAWASHEWNDNGLRIYLSETVHGVASGQVVSMYYKDWCLGSGIIKEVWTAEERPLKNHQTLKGRLSDPASLDDTDYDLMDEDDDASSRSKRRASSTATQEEEDHDEREREEKEEGEEEEQANEEANEDGPRDMEKAEAADSIRERDQAPDPSEDPSTQKDEVDAEQGMEGATQTHSKTGRPSAPTLNADELSAAVARLYEGEPRPPPFPAQSEEPLDDETTSLAPAQPVEQVIMSNEFWDTAEIPGPARGPKLVNLNALPNRQREILTETPSKSLIRDGFRPPSEHGEPDIHESALSVAERRRRADKQRAEPNTVFGIPEETRQNPRKRWDEIGTETREFRERTADSRRSSNSDVRSLESSRSQTSHPGSFSELADDVEYQSDPRDSAGRNATMGKFGFGSSFRNGAAPHMKSTHFDDRTTGYSRSGMDHRASLATKDGMERRAGSRPFASPDGTAGHVQTRWSSPDAGAPRTASGFPSFENPPPRRDDEISVRSFQRSRESPSSRPSSQDDFFPRRGDEDRGARPSSQDDFFPRRGDDDRGAREHGFNGRYSQEESPVSRRFDRRDAGASTYRPDRGAMRRDNDPVTHPESSSRLPGWMREDDRRFDDTHHQDRGNSGRSFENPRSPSGSRCETFGRGNSSAPWSAEMDERVGRSPRAALGTRPETFGRENRSASYDSQTEERDGRSPRAAFGSPREALGSGKRSAPYDSQTDERDGRSPTVSSRGHHVRRGAFVPGQEYEARSRSSRPDTDMTEFHDERGAQGEFSGGHRSDTAPRAFQRDTANRQPRRDQQLSASGFRANKPHFSPQDRVPDPDGPAIPDLGTPSRPFDELRNHSDHSGRQFGNRQSGGSYRNMDRQFGDIRKDRSLGGQERVEVRRGDWTEENYGAQRRQPARRSGEDLGGRSKRGSW